MPPAQSTSPKASLSHEERTATEPRASSLHTVTLNRITKVNSTIQTYKFTLKSQTGIEFLPGQWLDVHVPGIKKAGGFTITSAPRDARDSGDGPETFLELAVQRSPENEVAAWLWRAPEEIIGKDVDVRVGGSFVWPAPGVRIEAIERVVLIAGGVGINPLMSILSHLQQQAHFNLHLSLFYSTKLPSPPSPQNTILFLPRILSSFNASLPLRHFELFLTGPRDSVQESPISHALNEASNPERKQSATLHFNRMNPESLIRALGPPIHRPSSLFYVCGPPEMTDSIVVRGQENVNPAHVLCEKWW